MPFRLAILSEDVHGRPLGQRLFLLPMLRLVACVRRWLPVYCFGGFVVVQCKWPIAGSMLRSVRYCQFALGSIREALPLRRGKNQGMTGSLAPLGFHVHRNGHKPRLLAQDSDVPSTSTSSIRGDGQRLAFGERERLHLFGSIHMIGFRRVEDWPLSPLKCDHSRRGIANTAWMRGFPTIPARVSGRTGVRQDRGLVALTPNCIRCAA
jgi:hypothetical protein